MNQYISSTAVILSEMLKFALSTVACFVIDAKCNYSVFKEMVYNVLMEEGADAMKLCVPALLYTIQNNLQYVIDEAPLFLVLYQAKIITTAIFYSTLLSRRYGSVVWLSLIVTSGQCIDGFSACAVVVLLLVAIVQDKCIHRTSTP